jgi:hypothetical protein
MMMAARPSETIAVLVMLKHLGSPVVLYTDQPRALYDDLKRLMLNASPESPKLIERDANGPLQRVCFLDTDIVGLALQTDSLVQLRQTLASSR